MFDLRKLSRLVALAGGLILFGLPASAAGLWGAVVLDESIGAYGISHSMGSVQAARAAAFRLCRNTGARSCRLKTDFRGCAAIATDPNAVAYGIGLANSVWQAQRNAIVKCNRYVGGGCYSAGVRCN